MATQTQVRGQVTRDMIDRGKCGGHECPVAEALKVGVRNPYTKVMVHSQFSGGAIILFETFAVRDVEYSRVRKWIENYDQHHLTKSLNLVDPITFTLTFEGEFS